MVVFPLTSGPNAVWIMCDIREKVMKGFNMWRCEDIKWQYLCYISQSFLFEGGDNFLKIMLFQSDYDAFTIIMFGCL